MMMATLVRTRSTSPTIAHMVVGILKVWRHGFLKTFTEEREEEKEEWEEEEGGRR